MEFMDLEDKYGLHPGFYTTPAPPGQVHVGLVCIPFFNKPGDLMLIQLYWN